MQGVSKSRSTSLLCECLLKYKSKILTSFSVVPLIKEKVWPFEDGDYGLTFVYNCLAFQKI